MSLFYSEQDDNHPETIIPVYVIRPEDWPKFKTRFSPMQQRFAEVRNFTGESGQKVQMPNMQGDIEFVLFGAGDGSSDGLGPTLLGGLSSFLPGRCYRLDHLPADWDPELAAIGWGLGAYKFDEYLSDKKSFPSLLLPQNIDQAEISAIIQSIHMGRDLINFPAEDMGPDALEKRARQVARTHKASVKVTKGDALLKQNYPMIHAVGRAADQAPRLVELEWGDKNNPRLSLVGKGITFDSGGLNIKSAGSARLMKKDMGGAAHALALSQMIMANRLPVRLHLLLAIAENAISGNAFRPGDILRSRSGLTVEIDNTDAEGRLVLGDALARAGEKNPALIIDFATLTGAARVALGPTLPPFFCNQSDWVDEIVETSFAQADPVWHMPLWGPYMSLLSSPIADMKNAGGGFAGSVTAALFLQKFVGDHPWMHFDVYGWNPTARPAHPKGGEMFALRTLYQWLKSGGLHQRLGG